jgi:site-specific DNA-methyltransferase (cytosine-N4-specific)
LVIDIFGGSNTTGQVAEAEGRKWLSCELSDEYVAAGAFRFLEDAGDAAGVFNAIMEGQTLDLSGRQPKAVEQVRLFA